MLVAGPIVLLILVLILAISASWTNFVGAPWVPTTMGTVNKMLKLAEVGPDDIVYDLGCGDGRTIITAARRYGARAVGLEIDPLRYIWCQTLITLLGLRKRVRIVYGNFFKQDLSEATVVTCYLLQDTNRKLEEKFKIELRPGTRVVSNTFTFLGLHSVRQDGDARLYRI
ncbi:MAG: class I SAM-dependent methyltransferase [Anaerolineales bacterium]|jgi:ribosomal protein L11 methylase PrmA